MKARIDADALWSRPITEAGADTLARRYGFRFAGFVVSWVPGRWMAVFESLDAHGPVNLADGRTKARALRRGLELCRPATTTPADGGTLGSLARDTGGLTR